MNKLKELGSKIELLLSDEGCLTVHCDEKFNVDHTTYSNGQKIDFESLYNIYRHQHYSLLMSLKLWGKYGEAEEYLKEVAIPEIEKFLLMITTIEELEKKKEEMIKYNEERFACEFLENVLLKNS